MKACLTSSCLSFQRVGFHPYCPWTRSLTGLYIWFPLVSSFLLALPFHSNGPFILASDLDFPVGALKEVF